MKYLVPAFDSEVFLLHVTVIYNKYQYNVYIFFLICLSVKEILLSKMPMEAFMFHENLFFFILSEIFHVST